MKSFICLLFIVIIALFDNTNAQNNYKPLNVGIIIYDDVYFLDFVGPQEVFFDTFLDNEKKGFNVFLLAPELKPIRAHTGTIITPDYSILDCPDIDILVVPGGNLSLSKQHPDLGEFILKTEKKCKILMSVCTGAFILADLGLLDDKNATTWYGAKSNLKKRYPKIILSDERFTDNGKIITTAGISAGIDGSLHTIKKVYGEEIMKKTAKYLEWNFEN